jgi:hypothetical protein
MLHDLIQERAGQEQYVIAPPMEEYLLTWNFMRKFAYSLFYENLLGFDLSGIFDRGAPPHDLEFLILIQNFYNEPVAFAKTSRWFRGKRSFYYSNQDDIQIDFDEPDIDWYQLIIDADRREQIELDKEYKRTVKVQYFEQNKRISIEFCRPHQGEPMPNLWTVLEPMLRQFDEQK